MNILKRTFFNAFVLGIRAYQRLFLDLRVWGREHIPPGPKIYVVNHVTSTDPVWILPVFTEPVHVVIGPAYQSRLVGCVLDFFEQINAMPDHRKTVVRDAVDRLQRGGSIYMAPEGDIQPPFQLGHFHPGAARIYLASRVPIVPIAIAVNPRSLREWSMTMEVEGRVYRTLVVMRGLFCINVGEPMTPEPSAGSTNEQEAYVTRCVKNRIEELAEDAARREPRLVDG